MTRELRIVTAMAPDLVARLSQALRLDERREDTGGRASRGIETLEDVLRLASAQRPAWQLADVVVQDEFTHDVIIEGPAPAFLVFDTT